MTRKSKREIERMLEQFDDRADRRRGTDAWEDLEAQYGGDVHAVVGETCIELLRVLHDVSEPTGRPRLPEYLETVREQYEIEDDRDEQIAERLEQAAAEGPMDATDGFWLAPVGVTLDELSDTDSALLEGLAVTGRHREAKQLLVTCTYDYLGDSAGLEVTP